MSERDEKCMACEHTYLSSELTNGLCENCEGENFMDCGRCCVAKAESRMEWSDSDDDYICPSCVEDDLNKAVRRGVAHIKPLSDYRSGYSY